MGEWDELGNVAAQWWVLLQVSLLLTRLGLDRPAALLVGAFRANGQPHLHAARRRGPAPGRRSRR